MSPRSLVRRGFTLIEILLVIAVIGILSTLMFSLFKAARNGNNKAKARGEIQGLSMACEVYRKTYGDYPCGSTSAKTNGAQFRKDFFDQLVGRKRIYTVNLSSGGNAVQLLEYNKLPGGGTRKLKPFLSSGVVTSNDDKSFGLEDWVNGGSAKAYEFRDPWGNAYDYRYRVLPVDSTPVQDLTTGAYNTTYGAWKYPGFLIVSCGANYADPPTEGTPTDAEYWDGTDMPKTGTITPTYFNDDTSTPPLFQRADNIVNWANN
jgi:prepilin-type N-terminal cleavage/methylation domain-containing protein